MQPPDPAPPSRLRRIGDELILWIRTLTSAAVYATLVVTFGFQVARVEGRSMEPTLHDQDRLVVNKLAYQLHDPEVGDVVMLLHPNNPGLSLVKRVVAAPGETVAFEGGPPVLVPEGHYFVLGDNRSNSSDSRAFGAVPKKYILGRIQVRLSPEPRIFGHADQDRRD